MNHNKQTSDALSLILSDLTPQELEPRLELQVLVDPMSVVAPQPDANNVNCGKGATCINK
jgi:hypothetical protein